MASTAPSNPYVMPRASEMATRSLVSDPKPTSESSHDRTKPTLHRKQTDNYEQAAAAATKADQLPATTAGSVAASVTDRPGVPRQQSWKMSDFKGQQQGQMLSGLTGGHGYSTVQK